MPRNPELFSILGTLLFYLRRGFLAAVLCLRRSAVGAEDIVGIGTAGLPPRSVGELVPSRPIPEWIRTHLRMGHLPGSLPMAAEFLKAGYNVVTLNVLGKWEIVGPSAHLYPPEQVKEAEECMRTHVERCHAAGAKAVFYLGPVQVPSGIRILLAFLLRTPILRSLSRLNLPVFVPAIALSGSRNDAGIDDLASLGRKPFLFQKGLKFFKEPLDHPGLRQLLPEQPDGLFIRDRISQCETQEPHERYPVPNLKFEPLVRKVVQRLKHKHLEHQGNVKGFSLDLRSLSRTASRSVRD